MPEIPYRSTFISAEEATLATRALDDVERHVAWFYTTAVRTRRRPPPTAPHVRRLVRQILAETEAVHTLLVQLTTIELDGDAALDVAAVLTRALDRWRLAVPPWRDEARYRALAVSATYLVELAERLLDALTVAAWAREEGVWQRRTTTPRIQ